MTQPSGRLRMSGVTQGLTFGSSMGERESLSGYSFTHSLLGSMRPDCPSPRSIPEEMTAYSGAVASMKGWVEKVLEPWWLIPKKVMSSTGQACSALCSASPVNRSEESQYEISSPMEHSLGSLSQSETGQVSGMTARSSTSEEEGRGSWRLPGETSCRVACGREPERLVHAHETA